jgi:hypothetical protein
VHRYFADRPRDLVVMHIIDGQGWEVLCPFLGVAVPGVPFPRRNARTPVAAAM